MNHTQFDMCLDLEVIAFIKVGATKFCSNLTLRLFPMMRALKCIVIWRCSYKHEGFESHCHPKITLIMTQK